MTGAISPHRRVIAGADQPCSALRSTRIAPTQQPGAAPLRLRMDRCTHHASCQWGLLRPSRASAPSN
ncbi:queuine tRNA-ribosyltransferase domain protein [Synechococcus sp. PROS-U-1]|nr:queuine tRNA-ribosyltransferase domain protein [Synechococcus sp. PROS-U-1]